MKKLLITTTILAGMTLMTPGAFAQTKKVEKVEKVERVDTVEPVEPVDTRVDRVEKVETVETEDENKGGLFLEPALTYETGKGSIDFKSVAQPDGDLKGVGFGLRLGSHVGDILFLALDGAYSEPEFTDDSGSNFSYDLKSWLLGATIGLQTPVVGLRVWGSYIPFGEVELDGRGSNDSNLTYKEPEMWKLGAGFRVAMVSLNLEYLRGDYTKMEVKNAGSVLSGTYDGDATRESWIASVSFPLSL